MAQVIDASYKPGATSTPLSYVINRHLAGLIQAGALTGLIPYNDTPGYVRCSAGLAITAEGCRVQETTATDPIAIPEADETYSRYDAIVMRHAYQTADPMPPAYYEIVAGTPSENPEYPSSIPADALVLGYGLLWAGTNAYIQIWATTRPQDNHHIITVGGGWNNTVGEYNGEQGLRQACADLEPTGGIIMISGAIELTSVLEVPSGVELVGASPLAVITGTIPLLLRLRGAYGTGTLDGHVLTDEGADFTLVGTRSVVMTLIDGAYKLYYITSKDATSITLMTSDSWTSESCVYWVMNTACLRRLFIASDSATLDSAVIEIGQTFNTVIEECVIGGDFADGIIQSAGAVSRHTDIRRNYFSCGGGRDNIVLRDVRDCRIIENVTNNTLAGTGRLVISYYAATCEVYGNTGGWAYVGPEDPPSIPDIGLASYPFNIEHEANGTHKARSIINAYLDDAAVNRAKLGEGAVGPDELDEEAVGTAHLQDAAVTPAKMYTRVSAFAYITTNQSIPNGDNRLQFNGVLWDQPDTDRITVGPHWEFVADRAMVVRVSAVLSIDNWTAIVGNENVLTVVKVSGMVVDSIYEIGAHKCVTTDDYERLLTGSVLISLAAGEKLYLNYNNASAIALVLNGKDGSTYRSHVQIEEV